MTITSVYRRLYVKNDLIFRQDGAPSHTSRATQEHECRKAIGSFKKLLVNRMKVISNICLDKISSSKKTDYFDLLPITI